MIPFLNGGVALFIILLTTIYAGELVWRERQLRADGATDALPVPTSVIVGGKVIGFAGAMAVMLIVVTLGTIGVQTFKGYYHYELPLYLQVLLGVVWPTTIELTLLALLVHTLVNNKYVGHVVMILFYVLTAVLGTWGFERVLYQYGQQPTFIYSDMNRFGHYAPFMTWVTVYNCAIAAVLLVLVYLFWVQEVRTMDGPPDSRNGRQPGGAPGRRSSLAALTAAGAVASGGFVFYNTAILNPYASTKQLETRQVAYARTDYRHFKDLPQPRIVGVRIRADLVPEGDRAFALQSVYRLVNKRSRWPLDSLLVSLTAVGFGSNISGGVFTDRRVPRRLAGVEQAEPGVVRRQRAGCVSVPARDAAGAGRFIDTRVRRGISSRLAFRMRIRTTTSWPMGPSSTSSYFPGLGYDEGPEPRRG